MSYLNTYDYSLYCDMNTNYKSKFMTLPKDVKLESFVIDIDIEEELEYELDLKVQSVGCEEIHIDVEIMEFIDRVTKEGTFDFYCDWYNNNYYGTLEHPMPLDDEFGNLLTARSYYNCKNNRMVEMKLVFYIEQLEQTKQFLQQIGFTFERLDMSLFSVKQTNEQGSVDNPCPYLDTFGEMLCAYNNFTTTEDKTMCEMRLVFDGEQYISIIETLKSGGFNI